MSDEHKATVDELAREVDRLGIGRQVGFDRLHLYSIITHSTAIEGSTLTLEENTVMFDEGVVPAGKQVMEQLMNHDLKRAYEVASQIAEAKTPLSMTLLKALYSLVMKNTGALRHTPNGTYDESKGELRLVNVSAGRGGRSYLAWEKVETRSAQFVEWLNAELKDIDGRTPSEVYELSYEAHYRLVTIHPWSDGNGRMGRLLMNFVQMEGGVIPSYVRSENKVGYILALRRSQDERSSVPFREFMRRETNDILSSMLTEYRHDMEADVPWADEPIWRADSEGRDTK